MNNNDQRKAMMGKINMEIAPANNSAVQLFEASSLAAEKVRQTRLMGLVDPGATHLVLPARVVKQLGRLDVGTVCVRYADQRKKYRRVVDQV